MRAAAFALSLLLTACATMTPPVEQPVLADRLFCGRTIPGGGIVSDEEWTVFLRDVVTPRFPEGFTVWRADGQWRERDGTLAREPVMIIEIIHRAGLDHDRTIDEIADEYRKRFHQEAVLRVTMPARMDFID